MTQTQRMIKNWRELLDAQPAPANQLHCLSVLEVKKFMSFIENEHTRAAVLFHCPNCDGLFYGSFQRVNE